MGSEAISTGPAPPAHVHGDSARLHAGLTARVVAGLVLAVAIVLPPVVAIAALTGRRWYPVQDLAVVDLRVRDVWSVHIPLRGMYSRYGWDHPGPLWFWAIGLVSGAAGRAPWATRVGAALLEVVALAALAWVTWRRGLRILLAAATVTALTYLALGGAIFRDPWNPYVALPYFTLFVFLAWTVATGSFRNVIGMSLVGSFLVQTHVGYLPFVVVGLVWALVLVVLDHRRGDRLPSEWRRTAWIAGGVGAIAWLPAVVDTLVDPPGNIARVARFFVLGRAHPLGLRRGAGYLAAEFRWVPPWLGGPTRYQPFTGNSVPASALWLIVPGVFLVIGWIAVRSSGSRGDARLVGLAATVLVVGLLAMARVTGDAQDYLFLWRAVIAPLVVVATAWAVAGALAGRVPGTIRVATVVVVVIAVAWCSIRRGVSTASTNASILTGYEPVMREVARQLDRRPMPDHVILDFVGTTRGGLYNGVVDELARQGVTVYARANPGQSFGPQRSYRHGDRGTRWYVTEEGSLRGQLLALPGAKIVAATSPLSVAQDAELTRLQIELGSQLDAAGQSRLRRYLDADLVGFIIDKVPGIDHTAVDRVAALNGKVDRSGRCRCAIVSVSANAPNIGH